MLIECNPSRWRYWKIKFDAKWRVDIIQLKAEHKLNEPCMIQQNVDLFKLCWCLFHYFTPPSKAFNQLCIYKQSQLFIHETHQLKLEENHQQARNGSQNLKRNQNFRNKIWLKNLIISNYFFLLTLIIVLKSTLINP